MRDRDHSPGTQSPCRHCTGNSTPTPHFTGSVEAYGSPLGELRKARPSQEEAAEYSLTAWKLACGVWATGESSTPGSRVTRWWRGWGAEHTAHSREGGPHTPPLHQSSNSHGRQETTLHREVFPNEMDPIHTDSSLTLGLGLGTTLVRSLF